MWLNQLRIARILICQRANPKYHSSFKEELMPFLLKLCQNNQREKNLLPNSFLQG
jgi:hypothetical protein